MPTPITPGVIGITPTFYDDPDSADGLGIQRTQEDFTADSLDTLADQLGCP